YLIIVIVISLLEILIKVLKNHTIFHGRLHDAQGSRLLLISGIVLIYLIAGRTVGTESDDHAVQYLFSTSVVHCTHLGALQLIHIISGHLLIQTKLPLFLLRKGRRRQYGDIARL